MLATEEHGNLIGYVEFDTADLLSPKWKNSKAPVSTELQHHIWQYMRDSQTSGRGFFLDLTSKFKQHLRDARDQGLKAGKPAWAVPDVSIIRLVTQNQVRNIMRIRQQYWDFIAMMEQKEDEMGLLSPFCVYHYDELEVEAELR